MGDGGLFLDICWARKSRRGVVPLIFVLEAGVDGVWVALFSTGL